MSHNWPWTWDLSATRPHGWYVSADGRDCYGPLPVQSRKRQPSYQTRVDRTPEEQAASLLLENAKRAEQRRLIDPWRKRS